MRKNLLLLFLLLMTLFTHSYAQERSVRGKVKDAKTGEGIPGVSVFLKGTTTGTVTDAEGNYQLNANSGAILVFQSVGLKSQEVMIGAQATVDVQMETDVTNLDELVITGYREEDKRSNVGAAVAVQAKSIQQVPIGSFDQILQGQAPGLLVSAGSGQPGSAAQVRIRGVGSINAGNAPLYILDGVQITAAQFGTLNPNDFERVDVLKDAAQASIYGSRGTNGVVVITSKKGKAQKTQFNYGFQYGTSVWPDWKVKLLNTNQKIDLELQTGIGIASSLTSEQLNQLRTVETDWAREIFNSNARTVNHEISAQGGNEHTTFFVSGSVFKQEGVVRNTNLDRYTGRFNIAHTSGNFRFGTNFSLGYSNNNFTREGDTGLVSPLNAARWSNPYEPVFNAAGAYTNPSSGGFRLRSSQPNGVAENELNKRRFEDVKVVGNIYLEYDIPGIKGLMLRTNWGIDFLQREQTTLLDPTTASGASARGNQGSFFRQNIRDARFTGTNLLSYSTKFGEDHSLSVGLFQEIVFNKYSSFFFRGFGLSGRLKNEAGITGDNANFIPQVGISDPDLLPTSNALFSIFSDINYGFKDKYFLKAVVRRDGSSRFGANNRYAFFYSVGASWILSEENFMDFADGFLNNLKLRASYGTLGNQNIGDFIHLELYGSAGYGGVNGIVPNGLPNPDLKWESSNMFNVGLDFAFWNNRVSGAFDFYNRITNGLLLQVPLSRSTGFASQLQNAGSVRNRGVELLLNIDILQIKAFNWRISANAAYNKNSVLKLNEGNDQVINPINNLLINKVGYPLNSLYLIPYAGVNPANGDALYVDQNGNITPNYSPSYQSIFGTTDAPWSGGFTNTFSFKGFEASAFFTWQSGHYKYNNERVNIDNPDYITDNVSADLLRAWKQPGDITDIPRIENAQAGTTRSPYFSETTRYLEKSKFLRLRNVLISYTLPNKLLSSLKLRSLRVFVQGQNLLTYSPWRGNDPEVTNTNGAVYPTQRTYTVGLNLGF